MSESARQSERPRKVHPTGWEADDWDLIVRAAEILTERDHVNRATSATDVIRTGTMRFVDEVIASVGQPLKAS